MTLEDELSEQIEHRGWEIESNYHEHFLDDPDVDLNDFSEGNSGTFFGSIVVLAVLLLEFWGLKLWLTPPILNFPPAAVQSVQPQAPARRTVGPLTFDPTWTVSCFWFDGKRKLARPNYGNPNCTPQAARQRGEW